MQLKNIVTEIITTQNLQQSINQMYFRHNSNSQSKYKLNSRGAFVTFLHILVYRAQLRIKGKWQTPMNQKIEALTDISIKSLRKWTKVCNFNSEWFGGNLKETILRDFKIICTRTRSKWLSISFFQAEHKIKMKPLNSDQDFDTQLKKSFPTSKIFEKWRDWEGNSEKINKILFYFCTFKIREL